MKINNTINVNGRKSCFLKPADFYFTSEQMVIKTVLGSCLTITMFSKKLGVAAACHAVLPSCRDKSCPPESCTNKYRFVECVIPEMLRRFQKLGVDSDDIEIKMFGVADMIMFRKGCSAWNNQRVGRQNILMAREVAKHHNLKLNNTDVGGTLGRKIYFDTETGDVWMKRLCRIKPDEGVS